jgi:hypothetical protein
MAHTDLNFDTKEENQREFSSIQREVQDAQETADTKAAEVIRLREEHIRQAVHGVGVEAIVQKFSGLGSRFHVPWPKFPSN